MDTRARADVLIVGGGPIGLAQAWGIKKLNPALKVVVLEKRAEYQRSHTLVMQHEQLSKLMRATKTENDPALKKLLADLKKDPHIRTNELERIFDKLARDNGVEINFEEVDADKRIFLQQVSRFNPRLIIGADGTHSAVSEAAFPAGNQVKHEFDFVLQLRYEVRGDRKADSVGFIDEMVREGIVASEYVGAYKDGKTPVTMQMMITKEDFQVLSSATSKTPYVPYERDTVAPALEDISKVTFENMPFNVKRFITAYLHRRLIGDNYDEVIDSVDDYLASDMDRSKSSVFIFSVDPKSIRISVNEAPATHAEKVCVVMRHPQAFPAGVPVILMGDAGLGLSYFKGLNAGIETSAKFLSLLAPSLRAGQLDLAHLELPLVKYRDWFKNDYAPKKVKEVAEYSKWQIRSVMTGVKVIRTVLVSSWYKSIEVIEPNLRNYFNQIAKDVSLTGKDKGYRQFPHRGYDLVKFFQLDFAAFAFSFKKMGKLFADYIKPYKSAAQFGHDFKQPLTGLGNLLLGIYKIFAGMGKRQARLSGDGIVTILRALLELVTTPLAWFVKPIFRGLATAIRGVPNIENNPGMAVLAELGKTKLGRINSAQADRPVTSTDIYKLLAVCEDLHRKFDKSYWRGQRSKIALAEEKLINSIRAKDNHGKLDNTAELLEYFTLFTPAKTLVKQAAVLAPGNRAHKR